MFNRTEKMIVYLDPDTLGYMYLDYTGTRSYPVMKKLYTTLRDGFVGNWLVAPLSIDAIPHFIKDNRIDQKFLNMMGGIGQVQFLQRFTIKTLQLIRIINHFFENTYNKPVWRDAFSGNPDEKYAPEFSRYSSISAKNISLALEREKKSSQIYEFIDSYKTGKLVKDVARDHFSSLWQKFPDLIMPYFPKIGSAEAHMHEFLDFDEIQDIPQFQILSNVLYPLLDAYGLEAVNTGKYDPQLLAAEMMSVYLPYCHFYVTTVDIAELVLMTGFQELYTVKIYDHNESSLYKLVNDIVETYKMKEKMTGGAAKSQTMFKKGYSPY
jgi:hypothetical protein